MGLFAQLMRRKRVSEESLGETNLARVLGLVDLSCLAIGSTLGLGIYVLAGDVAKNEAGPAVVVSFLVAAVASLFAALCYAEFAARVPRAGSAYVYSYVCVGEFIAFIIGWNLILEYVIGTASVARGYSSYVDSIFDDKMAQAFTRCCRMNVSFLSSYPDFFAFAIVFVLTVLLAVGVKESTQFNNVFTFCNLVVVLYVIVCGLFKVDGANWKIDVKEVNAAHPGNDYKLGTGGFFPFGFSGMMAGAARCFYGFVGFDAVATTGEEAKNPQRNIPLSIVLGLTVIFFSYFGVSAVLTLMYPYYLQAENAPIPAVFRHLGWESARWIVTIGALFGLSSSLLGALFPLPRILYAMAKDGVIFRWMAAIHPRFQTPFWSTILAGLFAAAVCAAATVGYLLSPAAFMASVFDLEQLVDMMSIGTLLAYTLVGICVLVLRYKASAAEERRWRLLREVYRDESIGMVMHDTEETGPATLAASKDRLLPEKEGAGLTALLFNTAGQKDPTHRTAMVVNYVTLTYAVVTVGFCATIVYGADAIMDVDAWAVALTTVLGAVMLVCVVVVFLQPQSKAHLFFKVPLVPFLPMLSVFVNVYLMMKLSSATWIRFGAWMAIGFVVYFGYGLWFSTERANESSDGHDSGQRAPGRSAAGGKQDGIQLPTITVQPATPLNGSASTTPHSSRPEEPGSPDSQGEEPAFVLVAETRPEPLPKEGELHGEVNAHYVETEFGAEQVPHETPSGVAPLKSMDMKRSSLRTEDQEDAMLYMSHLVKHQHGLHAVICATLRAAWSDSGRGRQLALRQQQQDEACLTARYTAPPPSVSQYSPQVQQWVASSLPLHLGVCQCLNVPADGKPRPIRVSAEVHSDGPSDAELDSEDQLAAVLQSEDPLVSALARDDPEAAESLSTNLTEDEDSERSIQSNRPSSQPDDVTADDVTPDDVPITTMSDYAAFSATAGVLHTSVCECLRCGWIDLGKGALLADQQRERYAGVVSTSTPATVTDQPAPAAAFASAEELEALAQLLSSQHSAIVASLTAPEPPSTPPNTPTGQRRSRPALDPLTLSASLPASQGDSGGARARRPLSRALSGEAGFSTIPPQSPDSPFAKRVGNKFVIIPVDDGTDSEREEEAMDAADQEVKRAMHSVQHQVRSVLARADDGNGDDGDDEAATPTGSEGGLSESDGDATPTPGCSPPAPPLPPPLPPVWHPEQSDGQAPALPNRGEAEQPDSDSQNEAQRGSPDEPAPPAEVRRAMGSVLTQLRSSRKRPPPPPTPPGFTPQPKRAAPARRSTNPKLAAAPPEPSMKDQLDQIIAQAVAKAKRRIVEQPSSSGDDSPDPPTTESSADSAAKSSTASESPQPSATAALAAEAEPRPPLSRVGSGMHRVRSKKQKSVPTFDINELMARFEKK